MRQEWTQIVITYMRQSGFIIHTTYKNIQMTTRHTFKRKIFIKIIAKYCYDPSIGRKCSNLYLNAWNISEKLNLAILKFFFKYWLSKGLHTDINSLRTQAKTQNLICNASNHKLVQPRKYKNINYLKMMTQWKSRQRTHIDKWWKKKCV